MSVTSRKTIQYMCTVSKPNSFWEIFEQHVTLFFSLTAPNQTWNVSVSIGLPIISNNCHLIKRTVSVDAMARHCVPDWCASCYKYNTWIMSSKGSIIQGMTSKGWMIQGTHDPRKNKNVRGHRLGTLHLLMQMYSPAYTRVRMKFVSNC